MLEDSEDIFERQRLKVEAVAGVIVSRDRLRVAGDHDGFVTIIAQRKSRVAATIIELDPLPDAVRPAAKNDDFLLSRGRRLVFLFVSGIEVGRVAFELSGTSIYKLVDRRDAVLLAEVADLL